MYTLNPIEKLLHLLNMQFFRAFKRKHAENTVSLYLKIPTENIEKTFYSFHSCLQGKNKQFYRHFLSSFSELYIFFFSFFFKKNNNFL